jgi:integrase
MAERKLSANGTTDWEAALRLTVRNSTATGWTLREQRGMVRLEVRPQGQPRQSVQLPFAWSRNDVGGIVARVRNIYVLTLDGMDLATAAAAAEGRAPRGEVRWSEALEGFRRQKLEHGAAIQVGTWNTSYAPLLSTALSLLSQKKPPRSPAELMDACLRTSTPGSSNRQHRAYALAQFLRYCVEREHFPPSWTPPDDLTPFIGKPQRGQEPGYRKGHPPRDNEILQLIDSIAGTPSGNRVANALRLMAELGIRPVELKYLSIKQDPSSGEWVWWCSYRKRTKSGMTAERRLFPLPPRLQDGTPVQWNLMDLKKAELLEIPNLGTDKNTSPILTGYLKRKPGWWNLKEQMEARGENLVPYSLRHSYSLRGHQMGIDPGSLSVAMGHTLDIHLRAYPWASTHTTAEAFARIAGSTASAVDAVS